VFASWIRQNWPKIDQARQKFDVASEKSSASDLDQR
jgi:hypothetical protein